MNEEELREFCAWTRCKNVSDIILMDVGLCDDHLERYFRETPDISDRPWLVSKLKLDARKLIKEIDSNAGKKC